MKRLSLFIWTAAALHAQTLSMIVSPSSLKAGQSATLRVSYSTATPDTAGLQWTLPIPTGLIFSQSIGTAGASAGKQLACGPTGICLAYGINQTLIGTGDVAVYTITFPASAPAGTYSFNLSGSMGVSSSGSPLSVGVAGTPIVVALLSNYDLNGDGVVTSADVGLAAGQAIGSSACGTADFNIDSKCNLIDVMAVVLKSLGF